MIYRSRAWPPHWATVETKETRNKPAKFKWLTKVKAEECFFVYDLGLRWSWRSGWLTGREQEAAAARIKASLVERLFQKQRNSRVFAEDGRSANLLKVKLLQRETFGSGCSGFNEEAGTAPGPASFQQDPVQCPQDCWWATNLPNLEASLFVFLWKASRGGRGFTLCLHQPHSWVPLLLFFKWWPITVV